jgi:hypothetical protein
MRERAFGSVAGGLMIDGRERKPKDFETKLAWAKSVFGPTRPDIIGMQEIYDDSIQKALED